MQSYDSDRMYNKNMKTMFDFVKMAGCAAAFLMVVGCEETEIPGKAPELPVGEYNPVSLGIDVSQDGHVGGITQEDDGSYTIVLPDNGDPYIYLLPLEEDIEADNNVLAFEYMAEDPIDKMEVFFWNDGSKYDAAYSAFIAGAEAASEWTPYSARLKNEIEKFYWGMAGDYLRLDLGETNRNGSKITPSFVYLLEPGYVDEESTLGDTYEVRAFYLDGTVSELSAPVKNDGTTGISDIEAAGRAEGYTIEDGKLTVDGDNARVEIYNASGYKVYDGAGRGVSLDGFGHGLFILKVYGEDGTSETRKLMF